MNVSSFRQVLECASPFPAIVLLTTAGLALLDTILRKTKFAMRRIPKGAWRILPLPEGEGRGEGEGSNNLRQASKSAEVDSQRPLEFRANLNFEPETLNLVP